MFLARNVNMLASTARHAGCARRIRPMSLWTRIMGTDEENSARRQQVASLA
jgi:hypothetical protein